MLATHWHWVIALAVALAAPAHATGWLARSAAGESKVIERSYKNASRSSDGGTSSSNGRTRVFERVVSVFDGAAVIEYDLPPEAGEAERSREWQLPVRLKIDQHGTRSLVNEAELGARLDRWLLRANWTKEVCGKWIFTWNAFYIDCDPQSAIEVSETFGLRFIEVAEGTLVEDPSAAGPAILRREGDLLVAKLTIDPAVIAAEKAKADVAVAQIVGDEKSEEAALAARRKETVSGTVTLRFRTSADGGVIWRERVLELRTLEADGVTKVDTNKEITQIVAIDRTTGMAAR